MFFTFTIRKLLTFKYFTYIHACILHILKFINLLQIGRKSEILTAYETVRVLDYFSPV